MSITGHFEADFSQFTDATKDASATLKDLKADSVDTGKALGTMGDTAPAGIKQITAETKTATVSMVDMGSIVRQVGGMITGAFSVQAILQFTSTVLETADSIGKLAAQTGMTQKEVQQLQYISTQTSVSMGTLTSASQQLAADLGNNDKGVVGALVKLNISVGDFKRLDPYQQMVMLSKAVQGIEDPFKQAAAAEALFHGKWKEIYPAMKGDMEALGAQAPVMADAVLKGLQESKGRIDELKADTMAIGGFLVYSIAKLADFWLGNEAVRIGLAAGRKEAADGAEVQKKEYEALLATLPKVPPAQLPIIEGFKAIKLTAQEAKIQEDSWTDAIKERLAKEKEELDYQTASKAHWEEVAKLQEEVFGTPALAKAATWADAMAGLNDNVGSLSQKMRDDLQTALFDAVTSMAQLGIGTGAVMDRYLELIASIAQYNESMTTTVPVVEAASGVTTEYTQKLYDEARAQDALAAATNNANAATERAAALRGEMTAATGGEGGSGKIGYLAPRGTTDYASSMGSGNYEVITTTSGNGAGSSYYTPARKAAGGPVAAGSPYMVGEQGPELFVPGANGTILPNGAGGVVVQNTFHLVDTESNLARRVSDHILRSVTQARRV